MTEWYYGDLEVSEKELVPVELRAKCPKEDCNGELKANGMTWPMSPVGYHHTCDKCGHTVALSGKKYPRIVYKEWERRQRRVEE